ncbi:MAG: glycosyltransferase [Oceanipulchritudo sp.]
MSIPRVAIITRTKDRPLFLRRAMRSVLEQTFTDWIHVIVNDGGEPREVDLLVAVQAEAYAGRVKVVHHAHSQGMQNASNAGIAASKSTYLVIHDDDDSWYPDFLEKTVAFLEEQGSNSLVKGVATQSTQVIEEVSLKGEIIEKQRRPYYPFEYVNLGDLCNRNLFPPIAFLYRREVHEKIGLFRQDFDVLGDHDFNLRFVRHFEIGVIPTFHAYYHWRHGSFGNTVTRGRSLHRRMLNRMKNAYRRELLDHPETAVGNIDGIPFPPADFEEPVPFRLRTNESPQAGPVPDFAKEFDFEVLSLDVFDTALRRRCQDPKDLFHFLQDRAVRELGLPSEPYALARAEAERRARQLLRPEVTLEEIHNLLADHCRLPPPDARKLMELELDIEREMLYADPRVLKLYRSMRKAGRRVIFVSDMYLSSTVIRGLLEGCGFEEPEVHVSCELGVSKHEGELQTKVSALLDVEPGRFLHIGDKFHGDYIRSRLAGWQAFHWSDNFVYTPWFAETRADRYEPQDLLSKRIMGEVMRLGVLDPPDPGDLLRRLGREAAGPLYLCFMLWVLEQAQKDGIRKLVLVGRDGYYWEKTLKLLAGRMDLKVDFGYLHSSRKVLNFASFASLDEVALEFLLTPNPALKVRDFVDRTGLRAEDHLPLIRQAGFDDPDEVLTNENGGKFLQPESRPALRNLFLLLKPQLEALFAEDRKGMLEMLHQADYKPSDCAFVDIGWNASCPRSVARLLSVRDPERVRGYFFGTWKEADPADYAGEVKSYFMHMGEPLDHAHLVRESVNWIESLHAAPYPTLMAFNTVEGKVCPVFSDSLKSGFSRESQERIWKGAEEFLLAITENGLPATGAGAGHTYLSLVLNRLLREPSPAEVREWGGILHSEGFGLEVYKPLIEPVEETLHGQDLLRAYRSSNWRRGFLTALPPDRREYVLDREFSTEGKSIDQLKADLAWKSKQADELWGEKERYKWKAGNEEKRADGLQARLNQLNEQDAQTRGRLAQLQEQAGQLSSELAQAREELMRKAGALENSEAELGKVTADLGQARMDLEWEAKQIDRLWQEKEVAQARCRELEAVFRKRKKLLAALIRKRVPGE